MFLHFLIFTKKILSGCSWIVIPFWYGEGLDGGYFVTILIAMKFNKESMYYLSSSCVVMASYILRFFKAKHHQKWGSSQQNLIKRCSLSFQILDWIVHWIYHMLVMIHFISIWIEPFSSGKWFLQKSLRLQNTNDFHKFIENGKFVVHHSSFLLAIFWLLMSINM
jgi:hypothetical protein